MGQKVHSTGFRISSNKNYLWQSTWYSKQASFADKLLEDIKIRRLVVKKFKTSGVSKVLIERPSNKIDVNIYSSKPGVIIGKKGIDIVNLKSQVSRFTSSEVTVNVIEVKKPEVDAHLVAQNVAFQLEKRISFRKAIKRAIFSAVKMGAKGIRINVKGRIGGSDIARMEWYREGSVPLHTIRAPITYSQVPSYTKDGVLGVKVWVHYEEKKDLKLGGGLKKSKNVTSKKR